MVLPPTHQRSRGSDTPAAPDIQPDLSSVKWLSKKAIWCSRVVAGALVSFRISEKWYHTLPWLMGAVVCGISSVRRMFCPFQ